MKLKMAEFHRRTGSLVTLSNGNRTAQRNHPAQEFNNGVILSLNPLKDNQLFEVKIDRKVNAWSGSIEIGVTASDPVNLSFPTSATGFHEATWIMSGCSIMKDGHTTLDEYGQDLDQLAEGDRVGVMRTTSGALHIYVNGVDQGPAASGVPNRVWAIVDMYGKCAQVTLVDDANEEVEAVSNELVCESMSLANIEVSNGHLLFHDRHGTLIKLSNNRRTAERRRPLDEFNNGVVMTNRPLRDDELFEIRLDRLVDKWSGSIEVGITTHNPSVLDFPATMTNMRSGTIMMSGSGILTNGKGTRRQYGEFNLDELQETDRIGLIRKSTGTLHYYINGVDQGVAATKVPQIVWGVVDLYGMAVKVAITDSTPSSAGNRDNSGHDNSMTNRMNNFFHRLQFSTIDDNGGEEGSFEMNTRRILTNNNLDRLLFHSRCGSHAAVVDGDQRTAHRPNALEDFNNAVVMTHRVLRPGEIFEVRLDKMVDKWAGSIEIGVTTHSPLELDFPSTMTNIRTGTWMMTGNGVMRNGTTILEEYGGNLDRLQIGDRVGVTRRDNGTLHFFINGTDQGPASTNVPSNVYGVIDLYGQSVQATIVDSMDSSGDTLLEADRGCCQGDDLRFHGHHGENAVISSDGRTASRPSASGEFNDAIIMSHRPLADDELFEVSIDKIVERWSGSIEAGVTWISPEDMTFPPSMTEIVYDTWMLSGSSVMQDGSTILNGYKLDLDSLRVGSRVGMMRSSNGNLHFYLNGVDQGVACSHVPTGVYAVIDLYGQCAEVTITSGSRPDNSLMNHVQNSIIAQLEPTTTPSGNSTENIFHRFSECAGKNVEIKMKGRKAVRLSSFNQGLIFSFDPLKSDELFEVKVDSISKNWAGSLQIGLTTFAVSNSTSVVILPTSVVDLRSKATWVVTGSEVKKNGITIKENYCPTLERLNVNSRIGIKRTNAGNMNLFINGNDMGIAAINIPKNVFAVIDLYGRVDSVSITSNVSSSFCDVVIPPHPHFNPNTNPTNSKHNGHNQSQQQQQAVVVTTRHMPTTETTSSSHVDVVVAVDDESMPNLFEFHENRGKNLILKNGNKTVERITSYNHALVSSAKPLVRNQLFKIKINRLNSKWSSSLAIGIIAFSPQKWNPPNSALNVKTLSWFLHSDSLYISGVKTKEVCCPNLDSLSEGDTVGIFINDDSCLRIVINERDHGVVVTDLPSLCYAVVDLYGQCEQVSIVTEDDDDDDDDEKSRLSFVLPPPPLHPLHLPQEKEKADKEDGLKEKCPLRPTIIPNCEFQNICTRFKAMLGLPDAYFTSDPDSSCCCYCETCFKIRGDALYVRKGEPAKDFAMPVGWCKFNLRTPAKMEGQSAFDKWHIGFHGTRPAFVRKLLDSGELLFFGKSLFGGITSRPHFDEKNKRTEEDLDDVQPVVLSPTIKYAGSQTYAPAEEYRDAKTKKNFHVRVAIEVCVKPGSYKIGTQDTTKEQIDAKFSNSELQWSTKERGATVLHALLIKVE